MKRLLLISVGILSALQLTISCSQATMLPDTETSTTTAISFSPSLTSITKGLETTTTDIQTDGFGVYGYIINGSSAEWMMADTQVTMASGSTNWSYSPLKYWETGCEYIFTAYAPYNNENIAITTDTDGDITATLSLATTPDNMVDFVADQLTDVTYSANKDSGVNFNLDHQLTRVLLSGKTDFHSSTTTVTITDLKILAEESPAFFIKGTYDFGTSLWSDLDKATADYSIKGLMDEDSANIPNNASTVSIFSDDHYLFLLPPNGSTGLTDSTGSITLQIGYTINDNDTKYADETTISLSTSSLKQGIAYNYVLTFSSTSTEMTAEVIPWNNVNVSVDNIIVGLAAADDDESETSLN